MTGNDRGAGTDATVSLSLKGSEGIFGGKPCKLEDSNDNFERGKEDIFVLESSEAFGKVLEEVIY